LLVEPDGRSNLYKLQADHAAAMMDRGQYEVQQERPGFRQSDFIEKWRAGSNKNANSFYFEISIG
jgi:hypothetical protein